MCIFLQISSHNSSCVRRPMNIHGAYPYHVVRFRRHVTCIQALGIRVGVPYAVCTAAQIT